MATKKELIKELEELGYTLPKSAKKADYEKAIEEAKAELAENAEETTPEDDTAGGVQLDDSKPGVPEAEEGEYVIIDHKGDYVRTYSDERHGKDAEKKAKQFAKKIGGKIV